MGDRLRSLTYDSQTAKRGVENRAKILEAFETVPETVLTIQTAYNYLNPTADDEELCREFCRTLVRTLPGLLDVLLKRQPCGFIIAPFDMVFRSRTWFQGTERSQSPSPSESERLSQSIRYSPTGTVIS